MGENGDWREWSKFVIKGLDALNVRVQEINSEIVILKIELTQLKTKAGILGILGGILASLLLRYLFDDIFSDKD